MRLLRYLSRRSRHAVIAVGLLSIVVLGLIDFWTGPELSFSIFYLLPVSLVAWQVGRRSGIVASAMAAAAWLAADIMSGHAYSQPVIPYWNAFARFGVFIIVATILSSLRDASDRRGELQHFIIHDLRSPLGNVTAGLQILGEEVDARLQDLVEMSITSCNRMLTLINSLLDLARLEREKMPLDVRRIEVSEVVNSAIEQVHLWALQSRVKIVSLVEPDDLEAYADRTITERVLVNLLSNAVKHSPESSTITIRAFGAEAGTTTIQVTDEGEGVPAEWAEKVFDKFGQVEARLSDVRTGSGMGLAFCRLAVEAQNGRIWLEGAADGGTTVTFTLPSTA